MLRHVPQPLHARGLEPDVRVEAARDGAVDDGLLLLLQQRDQLLLGADVAPDPPVGVVEEADDGGLLVRAAGPASSCDSRSSEYSRMPDSRRSPVDERRRHGLVAGERNRSWKYCRLIASGRRSYTQYAGLHDAD